jgi:hypothetical protein
MHYLEPLSKVPLGRFLRECEVPTFDGTPEPLVIVEEGEESLRGT